MARKDVINTDGSVNWDGIGALPDKIGLLTNLQTTDKTDLVKAINENTVQLASKTRYATVTIAASDSSEEAKKSADYVCDGVNDEVEINLALQKMETVSGKLYLRNGTYHIDTLTYSGSDDWGYNGIIIGNPNGHRHVTIEGENQPWFGNYPDYQLQNGVRFKVSQAAFDAVPVGKAITGLSALPNMDGSEEFPGKIVSMKNCAMILPTNQRPNVIGVYLERVSGVDLENVFVMIDVPFTSLQLPATGTVGIMTPPGGRIADYKLETCYTQGFERGFDLPGEHIIATGLYANYCKYPYYLAKGGANAVYHTNLFLNCGHEDCLFGPYIGGAAQDGSLFDFISYDCEFDVSGIWAQQGGAIEERPGFSRGTITHTATQAGVGIANKRFWELGHGGNFKTWQSTDKTGGITAQRPFAPTLYQEYFDTTLGGKIIWDGTKWVGATEWLFPGLQNGWINYGDSIHPNLQIKKDFAGNVHIGGLIKSGTTTNGTVIFALPQGFMPNTQILLPVTSFDGTTIKSGTVEIVADGRVIIDKNISNTWLTFGNTCFPAEH